MPKKIVLTPPPKLIANDNAATPPITDACASSTQPASTPTDDHQRPRLVADIVLFRDFLEANSIPRSTGYRLVAAGKLEIVKFGRRSYLRVANVNDFIESMKA